MSLFKQKPSPCSCFICSAIQAFQKQPKEQPESASTYSLPLPACDEHWKKSGLQPDSCVNRGGLFASHNRQRELWIISSGGGPPCSVLIELLLRRAYNLCRRWWCYAIVISEQRSKECHERLDGITPPLHAWSHTILRYWQRPLHKNLLRRWQSSNDSNTGSDPTRTRPRRYSRRQCQISSVIGWISVPPCMSNLDWLNKRVPYMSSLDWLNYHCYCSMKMNILEHIWMFERVLVINSLSFKITSFCLTKASSVCAC